MIEKEGKMQMEDFITVEAVWQDEAYSLYRWEITASSPLITAVTTVYIDTQQIQELEKTISDYLENRVSEICWEVGDKRAIFAGSYVSFRFCEKDKHGHVRIEVWMGLEDGKNLFEHNCCFYVNTELGLLDTFCRRLKSMRYAEVGKKISLNRD